MVVPYSMYWPFVLITSCVLKYIYVCRLPGQKGRYIHWLSTSSYLNLTLIRYGEPSGKCCLPVMFRRFYTDTDTASVSSIFSLTKLWQIDRNIYSMAHRTIKQQVMHTMPNLLRPICLVMVIMSCLCSAAAMAATMYDDGWHHRCYCWETEQMLIVLVEFLPCPADHLLRSTSLAFTFSKR